MRKKLWAAGFLVLACSRAWSAEPSWGQVEQILGRSGVEQGEMLKIFFPRTDLNVMVAGVPVEPALALTGWAAFEPEAQGTLMTGEWVLLDSEVPGTLAMLTRNGIRVTGIHGPLLNETPGVKVLTFLGRGSRVFLAGALKMALDATGTPLQAPATPSPADASKKTEDWSAVQALMGPGLLADHVLQYDLPRAGIVRMGGAEIPPFMGAVSTFRFQKEGTRIVAAGNLILRADEVDRAVESLTRNHLTVTAIQNLSLDEEPRIYSLNFWALGEPASIVQGINEALEPPTKPSEQK